MDPTRSVGQEEFPLLADLHIHSQASDGTYSCSQIISECWARDIGLVSVTDHNTLGAYPEIQQLAEGFGIQVLCGVEIDCTFQGVSYHLLGYGFDPEDQPLRQLLARSRRTLDEMSDRLVEALAPHYPQVSLADYESYTYDRSRGGWKGLCYLIDRGLATCLEDAMPYYKRYGVTYEQSGFAPLEEACQAVHAAGGFCVLAHPVEYIPLEELPNRLELLCRQGVDGVECYYPARDAAYTDACLTFCREHGLFITCGGDSHGAFNKEIHGIVYRIGAASRPVEDLCLPEGVLPAEEM